MVDYNKKVLKHFFHPKNQGELKNPDGIGKVGNPKCGDVLVLQIKVGTRKGKEYIKDIKFKTLGCAAAISTSSVLTELAKGKSIEQAEKISDKDIVNKLGGLPEIKYHCSLLGTDALKLAIKDYKKNKEKKHE